MGKRLWCRLGFHPMVHTGRTVTETIFEGPCGKRLREYPVQRCVHCGLEGKDYVSSPRIIDQTVRTGVEEVAIEEKRAERAKLLDEKLAKLKGKKKEKPWED